MSWARLTTEPIKSNVPSEYLYLFIDKEYPKPLPLKGRKTLTKEQKEAYEEMTRERQKMFDMLDSGTYDIGNNIIKLESIGRILGSNNDFQLEKCFVYKIKPLHSEARRESYSYHSNYHVSKFEVEKKMEGLKELIDYTVNEPGFARVMQYVTIHGLKEEYRKETLDIFEYVHHKYPKASFHLEDVLYDYIHRDGEMLYMFHDKPQFESYIQTLLALGYVTYSGDKDMYSYHHDELVKNLIKANWFSIAVDYLESLTQDMINVWFKGFSSDFDVKRIIRSHDSEPIVKKLIQLLGVESTGIKLKVRRTNDSWDGFAELDEVWCEDMSDVRTYAIKYYGVTYDMATEDVSDWRGDNDEYFIIE